HAGARLGTIVRGPGDLWDRARLLAFLARDVVWSRDEFAREIGAYARYVFSRGAASGSPARVTRSRARRHTWTSMRVPSDDRSDSGCGAGTTAGPRGTAP